MKKTQKLLLVVLLTILFAGCHCIMYEKKLIVNKVEKGNEIYKYSYWIEAYPVDQVIYSNKVYQVGDTIKIN